MITEEEKEYYEKLKYKLVDTIKAIQKEGKLFPEEISKAMTVVYLLDEAIRNDDHEQYIFLLNELADDKGDISFLA